MPENAASIIAATWGRTLTIPGGWNSIRIGMRMHATDFGATITTPDPNFYFGLQSGNTTLPGEAITTNWIGMVGTGPWSRSVLGGAPVYNIDIGGGFGVATKVGATFTPVYHVYDGQNRFSVGGGAASNAADRAMYAFEITKGSPDFEIRTITYGDTNAAPIDDLSQSDFLAAMVLADPTVIDSRYFYTPLVGTVSLPFSESNGVLDTISFWWSNPTVAIEICDIAAFIIS